uniref:Mu NS viral factory protein n=1 Tax=Mammalian orthoreovirus TaxID=351073 RepID=A0A8A1FWD8_9REOV|nr:mu NS viral factory protein [Mammalian orthoreovirus]
MASFKGFSVNTVPVSKAKKDISSLTATPGLRSVSLAPSVDMSHSREFMTKAIEQGSMSIPYQHVNVPRVDRKVVSLVVRPFSSGAFSISGVISPAHAYLLDCLPQLEQAMAFVASPESFQASDVAKRFAIKPGMSLQDAITAFINFVSAMLKMTVTRQNFDVIVAEIERLASSGVVNRTEEAKVADEELMLFGLDHRAPQQLDVSNESGMRKAMEIQTSHNVHLAPGVGNIDPEIYNEGRFMFMQHKPLAADQSYFTLETSDYFKIYPTYDEHDNRMVDQRQSGLLLCTKDETLAEQTIFKLDTPDDKTVHLLDRNDDHVVARFTRVFIEDVAPSHHAAQRSNQRSVLDDLYANTQVISITANALRWVVKHSVSDGIVNRKNVKICVGFDPLYTLATYNGVSLCSLLMDEKLSVLNSACRMTLRSLMKSGRDSDAHKAFQKVLSVSYASLICYYHPSRKLSYGELLFQERSSDAVDGIKLQLDASRQCHECPLLQQKVTELEKQLLVQKSIQADATPMALQPLLAQLRELSGEVTRLQIELSKTQAINQQLEADMRSAQSCSLDMYLRHHTCINGHAKEDELLDAVRIAPDVRKEILTRRGITRQEWCDRISRDASAKIQIQLDDLNAMNSRQAKEINELRESVGNYEKQVAELVNTLTQNQATYQQELQALVAKNIELDTLNQKQAKSMRITPSLLSATPTDSVDGAVNLIDFSVPADEL